jgi:hypothetical protein
MATGFVEYEKIKVVVDDKLVSSFYDIGAAFTSLAAAIE